MDFIMNNTFRRIIAAMCVMTFTLGAMPAHKASASKPMRGVWVSTVFNIDYPSRATTNADTLMAEADEILDGCSDMGFNAVFLQVCPSSDAFYKSEIYPWSKFLTGSAGTAPDDDLDPLAYWIDEAHERGIELHAWINPYRVTTSKESLDSLAWNSPARQHPEYTINYKGNYYYNPSYPEVRQMITDVACEIADNYDVDGIHMDDYFYPGTDIDDSSDYAYFNSFNEESLSLADWRRSNCDALILSLSEALHERGVTFGISPVGIWANAKSNPFGSDTNGLQSYSERYADSRKWALEGWVDYIAPQIYWEIGYKIADYATLLEWWSDTLSGSDTKLYIGMADYRCENASSGSVWYNGAGISDELWLNYENSVVDGEIHFTYGSIASNTALREIVTDYNVTRFISVNLNGEEIEFDQNPVIVNDRTLVPMRAIFEALGMDVIWDGDTQEITAEDGTGKSIGLTIGDSTIYTNEGNSELDAAPMLIKRRTYVPLRAVSEAFGAEVTWNGDTKTVDIWTY